MAVVRQYIRKQVQADGEAEVPRMEIDQIVRACRWNVIKQLLGKVSVGINEADTMSSRNVLHDQIPQEGRLSRARLADDVEVLSPVSGGDPESHWVAPAVSFAYDDMVVWVHDTKASRHSCNPEGSCVV